MSSQSISFKPTTIIRNLSWGIDERRATTLAIVFLLLGFIGGLYIYQSGAVTATAVEAASLQRNIVTLQRQNDSLRAKIAHAESMAVIKQRAADLNLAPTAPANIEYLVVENLPDITPANDLPAVTQVAPASKSTRWFDAVVDWLAGVSK